MDEIGFDWDQWNIQKNEEKHGISSLEGESIFYDPNLKIFADQKHTTTKEGRWIAYGKGVYHRVLMAAFTVREGNIRIISARMASRKERNVYEKE
jgi:uncharacterized DUF497 family protein